MVELKNAEEKVEQALMLLASVDAASISLREAVEIIEIVTAVPELVRKTIAKAEERGIVKRVGDRLLISERIMDTKEQAVQVKRLACDAQCMRCGRRISACFFLIVAESEFGPFGSECIKRLRLG